MEIKTNLNLKYKNIRQYAMPLRCLSEFCKLISSSTSFVSQTMHDVFLDLFDEGMHYISNYPIVNERVIASHIDLPAPKKKKTPSFFGRRLRSTKIRDHPVVTSMNNCTARQARCINISNPSKLKGRYQLEEERKKLQLANLRYNIIMDIFHKPHFYIHKKENYREFLFDFV